jgi:DNA-binding protein H-NS
MPNIQDLLAQKATLEKQIETARKQARVEAVAKVKALMAEYGLSVSDLNTKGPSRSATKGGKVAAKYRNSATGDTWSGRGLQPKWLKAELSSGRKLEDFAV